NIIRKIAIENLFTNTVCGSAVGEFYVMHRRYKPDRIQSSFASINNRNFNDKSIVIFLQAVYEQKFFTRVQLNLSPQEANLTDRIFQTNIGSVRYPSLKKFIIIFSIIDLYALNTKPYEIAHSFWLMESPKPVRQTTDMASTWRKKCKG